MKCTGCNKPIITEKETYWKVYPNKVFCGINCYKKDQQQEVQKTQALAKK